MTAQIRKHHKKCPYWSSTSMQCRLCKEGLYIPLDDYVDVFCKTQRFSACMKYNLHFENQFFLLEKVRKYEENRRKHLRTVTSNEITLVKVFKSGELVSQFTSSAKTIDVSKSGMRMATDKPLIYETTVQFFFTNSFPQALHEITGQVEWCNKQIDEPGYQAGISFQENHIIEAMGSYLRKQAG